MKKEDKPKVGQKFFIVTGLRGGPKEQSICTVSKVGRKYFTVEWGDKWKRSATFNLEDFRENTGGYAPNLSLYNSKKEWEEEILLNKWQRALEQEFRGYGRSKFSLDQLIDAANILGITID